jgi:hypothetical protein
MSEVAVGDPAFMTSYDAHVEAWWARGRARRRWGDFTGCLVLEHGVHELPEGVWQVVTYGLFTMTRDWRGPCEVAVTGELAVARPRQFPIQEFTFDVRLGPPTVTLIPNLLDASNVPTPFKE